MKNLMKNIGLSVLVTMTFSSVAMAEQVKRYERKTSSGSIDVLTVYNDILTLEITRQVGGPGGSAPNAAPYPTVCRYKIAAEGDLFFSGWTFQYRVADVTLIVGARQNPSEVQSCVAFVKEFNREARARRLVFSEDKRGFVRVK